MTPEQHLNQIAQMLSKLKPARPGLSVIELIDGIIGVYDYYRLPSNGTRLACLTSKDINEGLTPKAWSNLWHKIHNLQLEGKL